VSAQSAGTYISCEARRRTFVFGLGSEVWKRIPTGKKYVLFGHDVLLGGVDLSGFFCACLSVKLHVNRTLKQVTNRFERGPQSASNSRRIIAEQPL